MNPRGRHVLECAATMQYSASTCILLYEHIQVSFERHQGLYVKPGNKNQKLGTIGDFEFVVDYASMISLDIVFKIS